MNTSSFILVAIVFAVTIVVSHGTLSIPLLDNLHGSEDQNQEHHHHHHHQHHQHHNHPMDAIAKKAIETICQFTQFKESCVESLSSAAQGIGTDPKELVKAAFGVAVHRIREVAKRSVSLQEVEKDPRCKQALVNCNDLMDDAVEKINESFEKFGGFGITKIDDIIDDLKIWLSAAVTYQETCLDGFENTTSNAGEKMKIVLNASTQLTRNSLSIVSHISSAFSSFPIPNIGRILHSEEPSSSSSATKDVFPTWVSGEKRKLLQASSSGPNIKPNVVVAKDGSGKYKTINEALNDVPKKNNASTFVIYIKEGVYNEYVMITKSMTNLMIIGDGPTKTKITGNKNFVDGTNTFNTATFAVAAPGFIAKDIGFENTAGAIKHQAVALRVQSDMSIFHNCQMDGYQDTLYAHALRQFYRDCTISGTIDFIFGNAASVFQNCKMVVRKPLDNQQCIVTAQGRKDQEEPTGIVLQGCHITADPLYFPVRKQIRSYLGRPWKEYSRTIIMQSEIDDLIQPEGWLPWMGDFALNTCFYAEYNNKGPGANLAGRVKWAGVKTGKLASNEFVAFTPGRFLTGDSWIKLSGVPFTSGMLPM